MFSETYQLGTLMEFQSLEFHRQFKIPLETIFNDMLQS